MTQVWLATDDGPEASTTGRYWFHQQPAAAHPAASDTRFQGHLLEALAGLTGVTLTPDA